jgi:hypothetical protein
MRADTGEINGLDTNRYQLLHATRKRIDRFGIRSSSGPPFSVLEVNVELTEIEILILRGLDAKPAIDIPGGIVDDNVGELIDIGYISVHTVGNLFSYEITDDGRAALKRSESGASS